MAVVSYDEAMEAGSDPLDYFPHDAWARMDVKCRKLIRRYGYEGYGRWWALCEIMASTSGHMVTVRTNEELDFLADDLGFPDCESCKEFLDALACTGLINAEMYAQTGRVVSDRMLKNAYKTGLKRAGGRRGGRPRKTKDKT